MDPGPQALQRDGFALLPGILTPDAIAGLIQALASVQHQAGVRTRTGIYAIRNLLTVAPPIAELAESAPFRSIVARYLRPAAIPVRATLFDKTPGANWFVPWHQDLTICVNQRHDHPGYGPWTRKAGVWNVQPPVAILKSILSLRLHLDPCPRENGALRVLPCTHCQGRLTTRQIAVHQSTETSIVCAANPGDILLMKPLLLHASSASRQAAHRRVIHIDYAAATLPPGLTWQATENRQP